MIIPTTRDELSDFLQTKDELEQRIVSIGKIVSENCIYDALYDYGLDKDMIVVCTEDYWSDGTHDTESVSFPIEYLAMTEEEIKTIVLEVREQQRKEEEYRKQIELNNHYPNPNCVMEDECDSIIRVESQGLEEGISCAMCTNSMHNDRGCDGGCRYDENMYKRVLDVIYRHTIK